MPEKETNLPISFNSTRMLFTLHIGYGESMTRRSFATCAVCGQSAVSMQSHLHFSGSSQPCAAQPVPHRAAVKQPITNRCAHRSGRSRGLSLVVRAASDYYDLLGVSKSADKKEIKQAYRQKARKFHPVRIEGGQALLVATDEW